jgi:hypothetical protein
MKIGIVLDAWKLTIFKRRLDRAGFVYQQHPGITSATLTLTLITDDQAGVAAVVQAANNEAARVKARNR